MSKGNAFRIAGGCVIAKSLRDGGYVNALGHAQNGDYASALDAVANGDVAAIYANFVTYGVVDGMMPNKTITIGGNQSFKA